MKKALITGGGGFVGSAIVKKLLEIGVEPVVVGRQTYPELIALGVEVRQGDIRDRDFLVKACRDCDTVFHVAAKAGIWGARHEYFSINLNGTENVIFACKANKISRLVYTSTPSVVFAQGDLAGVDERMPYSRNFLCHYAASKAMAEQEVLAANSTDRLRTVALRPHLVWGPGDTNLIPRLLERGRNGLLKQVGDGRNLVDISYIDNVVDAHLLAAANLNESGTAAGKAYFISQGEPVNLWSWINELFSELAIPPVIKKVNFKKAYLAGMVLELVYKIFAIDREPMMTRFLAEQLAKSHWFSIKRARLDFGYQPKISTREGIARLVAWVNIR